MKFSNLLLLALVAFALMTCSKTELATPEKAHQNDPMTKAENNKILSEDRARACYAYLVSEGISPKRISFQGFGEEQPIATNDTRSGRTLNRRVEFNLYIE